MAQADSQSTTHALFCAALKRISLVVPWYLPTAVPAPALWGSRL